MSDLRDRFRNLDRVPAPGLWSDVTQRAAIPQPRASWGFPTLHRIGAIALAATAVVVVLVGIGLFVRPPTVGPPPPLDASPPETIASGTWAATGEMITGRYEHSATLLADGRVLVAGGRSSNDDPLTSVELFDPETGSWSRAADLPTPITDPSATLLTDGRVLVVGNNDSLLYDPETDSWRAAAHVASASPTSPGPATLLADGRVLLSAAMGTPLVYDPADDSWSETGPMLTPRYNHVAALLADGSVLVAGGDVYPDVGLISAERYDPAANSWTATGESLRPRTHSLTLLPDGRVLDVGWSRRGGPFGELYDPDTGSWSSIDIPLPLEGSGAPAPLLPDGTVLFVNADGDTALYHAASGSWFIGPPMVQGRSQPTVTALANGDVLVAGGIDGRLLGVGPSTGVSSAELYHPGGGPAAVESTPRAAALSPSSGIGQGPTEDAPLECGFPTGTRLAFAGIASPYELGLGLENESQQTWFYVTAEPVDMGALAPPARQACQVAGWGLGFWDVPRDWIPPAVDDSDGN